MRSDLDSGPQRGFFHVDQRRDYFTYQYAFGESSTRGSSSGSTPRTSWHDLRDLPRGRGSARTWLTHADIAVGDSLDIRPGDIVLIDHSRRTAADHIVMVHSSTRPTTRSHDRRHRRRLMVDTGARPPRRSGRRRRRGQARESSTPPPASRCSGRQRQPRRRVSSYDLERRPRPLFGIGRPSIADFEDHRYDRRAKSPRPRGRARRPAPRAPCAASAAR